MTGFLNLYKLHATPDVLDFREEASVSVVELFWPQLETVLAEHSDALRQNAFRDPDRLIPNAAQSFDAAIKRFDHLRPAIATSAFYAQRFADCFLRSRFMEGEAAIATCAWSSKCYAENVIRGRFLAGEPAITKNLQAAAVYARDVIKGRFVEAEPLFRESWYAMQARGDTSSWFFNQLFGYYKTHPEAL